MGVTLLDVLACSVCFTNAGDTKELDWPNEYSENHRTVRPSASWGSQSPANGAVPYQPQSYSFAPRVRRQARDNVRKTEVSIVQDVELANVG